MEYGTNTEQRIKAAINKWVPDANNVLVVLNEPGFGGCGGGGRAHVPLGVDWDVIAHEFGHGIGGFADEYSDHGNYTGGEQGWINLTTITDRATTKWQPVHRADDAAADRRRGRPPTTTRASGRPTWSSNFDAGLFEGGGTIQHRHLSAGRELPDEQQHARSTARSATRR